MTLLKVRGAKKEEIFEDIVRINASFRRDKTNKLIPAGSVCRISVGEKFAFVIARGLHPNEGKVIRLDEVIRSNLGIANGQEVVFSLQKAKFLDEFRWCWNATDPAYRITARLAVLSVILGGIGLILGVISIWLSLK